MGFVEIGWIDVVDIFAVAMLIYYLYKMAKGTTVPNITIGIVVIFLLWKLTTELEMELLSSILKGVINVGVIAIIVVFQPEIRQFLQTIGMRQRNSRVGRVLWRKIFGASAGDGRIDVSAIVRAAVDMSEGYVGALMVIRRDTDLGFIAETGIAVDAQVSAPLLENIFFKNAPLHDGAVIIDKNRIVAAKCVLPSTSARVPKNYGMRHRAALGISEVTDAVVVVVSEETGGISIAHEGAIERAIPHEAFEAKLRAALNETARTASRTTSRATSRGTSRAASGGKRPQ
jgi:uncharacterized protein (TIGR00159 family)